MKTEFQVGDHIVSGRHFLRVFAYTHHGIYVGDGRVIHYEGNAQPRQTGPIKQVSLEEFAGGPQHPSVFCNCGLTPRIGA
ncbi:MAG: lecithin retinol acyltransferase family protein [Alphaproteobacteria bacterium]|nr:lecithin retinol acyltransferase family protein [Alphaproteobacteria bacterium]